MDVFAPFSEIVDARSASRFNERVLPEIVHKRRVNGKSVCARYLTGKHPVQRPGRAGVGVPARKSRTAVRGKLSGRGNFGEQAVFHKV